MRRAALSTRAWLIVIVVLTLLGGFVGALVSRDIAPSYSATATLLVGGLDRPELAADFETSAMVAAIYGGLIRSETVLEPVISHLNHTTGWPTDWQDLRQHVHVDLGANDVPIISLTVYARSSEGAAAIASAITDRLLDLSQPEIGSALPNQAAISGHASSTQLERAISKSEQRLSRLETRTGSGSNRQRIQRSIDRESDLLMLWQDLYRVQVLASDASANDLQILQPAEPTGGKIRPRLPVNIGLGLVIGCSLGLCAFIIARGRHPGAGGSMRTDDIRVDDWASELTRPQGA